MSPLLGRAIGCLCFILALQASADSIEPPERYTGCSPKRTYCFVTDPSSGTRVFHQKSRVKVDTTGSPDWALPDFHRTLYVSDDGLTLGVGVPLLNLIDRYEPGLVLVTFVRKDHSPVEVRLSDIVPQSEAHLLKRTGGGRLHWGEYLGFDRSGMFVLQTVTGRVAILDPIKGRVVATSKAHPAWPPDRHKLLGVDEE